MMPISHFFRETLRAPLKNERWSWGAYNDELGVVVLRVWDDDIRDGRVWVFTETGAKLGSKERQEHIARMENGVQGYGVRCRRNRDHRGPSTIEAYDDKTLLVFGVTKKSGGRYYATIVGSVTVDDYRAKLDQSGLSRPNSIGQSNGDKPIIDRGSSIEFDREGHSVDPKHHEIVDGLKEELERLGWRCSNQTIDVSPDLLVTNGERKILFEVKPDDSPASFHCAIGQLLVYRQALGNVHKSIIVALDKPQTGRSFFEAVMSKSGIDFVQARKTETETRYIFEGLKDVLNAEA